MPPEPVKYRSRHNVVSVGGTTLRVDSQGNYVSESAWSGSGGGISRYESQPSYQQGVVTQSTTKRTGPDVSYDADPNTAFYVYDSYGSHGGNWWAIGGTSAGSPQWAALVSIADQMAGHSLGLINTKLYSLASSPADAIHTGADPQIRHQAGAEHLRRAEIPLVASSVFRHQQSPTECVTLDCVRILAAAVERGLGIG